MPQCHNGDGFGRHRDPRPAQGEDLERRTGRMRSMRKNPRKNDQKNDMTQKASTSQGENSNPMGPCFLAIQLPLPFNLLVRTVSAYKWCTIACCLRIVQSNCCSVHHHQHYHPSVRLTPSPMPIHASACASDDCLAARCGTSARRASTLPKSRAVGHHIVSIKHNDLTTQTRD